LNINRKKMQWLFLHDWRISTFWNSVPEASGRVGIRAAMKDISQRYTLFHVGAEFGRIRPSAAASGTAPTTGGVWSLRLVQ